MKRKGRIFVCILILIVCTFILNEGSMFVTGTFPDLKPGDKGDGIKEVQQNLKNWGYYEGSINGYYDFGTFLAVMGYQRDCGIELNGIADKNTQITMGLSRVVKAGVASAQGTSDEQLLARAINGEARGEPYEGQVAVGAVIINRTRDSRFPKTIAGVIYQPGAFTAVSDGQINVALDEGSTVAKAARDALNGWDPTNGSLYYWNPATATSKWIWSRKITLKIGKHNFGI